MKTTIDWLTFRAQTGPYEALEAFRPMFGTLGAGLRLKALEHGSDGWERAAHVMSGDMPMAKLDFGGDSQRGWLRASVSGKPCEWVEDWDAVDELEKLPSAEPRRLDIALTTWAGEVTHDMVLGAHASGRFVTSGRPPALRQILSTDPKDGRSCYVGKRTSDKMFRAYEKGHEMVSKFRGLPGECTHIDGHPIEDIYRCELELKSKNASLTWDVIERRDQYFSGAYPFCAEILPGIEADILQRRKQRAPQTDLAAALANCRIQFGPTLFTALRAYHGDMTTIWDKILGDHHCKSLLEAGVLMVDHE